ncbi:N-acetylglucosamine-6-phosphate deacetylase [Listeria sp. FSL L7-1485]|uniref:N-acetylglucosamine-6-phosphate deacetylase n=1 Tax=Listeria immobilis TaxID=2713502 RepID=A0A7X0X8N7_9LIST|nr:N-acetylglucosamine-6-phosphate deacetylase [Listeria immobilis]MBC1482813.1 N-acetylglucosamine-6-phosphate deacetylase [Listeria immobilis]MBC1489660.1 N-acetylglucosamine-6-phosphate deacetylase [Listeria immobilis]MBC1506939.1 N-acetylglucosamine-6-phosphate deacetylase [Listeria immobilis]MBC1510151.1 N-acetylglucosamine-6-phosphate deacetylase [Listeria immobilis]MBC1536635.1 N-acetylglucosamine-6-phosphate deacetylase [Listeria immobilis]
MTMIKNVKVYQKNDVMDVTVIIEKNIIKEVLPSDKFAPENYSEEQIFDGKGQLLIPGMIDVHIHGANNYNMMDGSTESIQAVSMACAETGCTSFLVTSVSSSLEDLIQMIKQTKKVIGKEKGAKIAGIHLEGPYLNIEKKGMQNPAYLRHPDLNEMIQIFDEADGLIKMVTIAPELPGGIELIEFLKKRGVVVAIAHSNATYEEAQNAFEKGASHITHCFNAMPTIHHRSPGLVTAALENDSISVQTIVDGVHLHPGIVRLIHKIKGPDKVVLTTDALQAMGVGDGTYIFGGHQVTVKEGIARLEDGTLASSTVTMNKSLRLSTEFGINLQDSIQMATSTPATILGMENLGQIEEGYMADLVLLDNKFEVLCTWINGEKY